MDIRTEIESFLDRTPFEMPMFYQYPGGLRFELSEGDTQIAQFLSAMWKATKICADIFDEKNPPILCFRTIIEKSKFSHRKTLKAIQDAEIKPPRHRAFWLEPFVEDEPWAPEEPAWWLNLAFELPSQQVQNALWVALSKDLGLIRPNPRWCSVYLFSRKDQLVVLPYDDRGMDIVGPNTERLRDLYNKHYHLLLGYDLETMHSTFGPPSIK